MKKLLLTLCFVPAIGFSQMTQNNEPAVGATSTLYLCDSNVTQYANLVGSNQTWDYSTLAGITDPSNPGNARTKDVTVTAPNTTTSDSLFIGSLKKYSIGPSINTFYSSTATQRISQGYMFNESSLGNVIVNWTGGTTPNNEILNDYPFALAGLTTDIFSGTITSSATGTIPSSGSSVASLDGTGTLLLPGGNSYANVLRYHLKDSATAVVFGQTVSLVRNWYEYYDYTVSNLPIFISIDLNVNLSSINSSSTIVLSKIQPTTFVGMSENELTNFKVYPNPVNDILNIEVEGNFDYQISTINGEKLTDGKNNSQINISDLPAGFYLITINTNSGNNTLKFLKK
jgi:hypothetical protein